MRVSEIVVIPVSPWLYTPPPKEPHSLFVIFAPEIFNTALTVQIPPPQDVLTPEVIFLS